MTFDPYLFSGFVALLLCGLLLLYRRLLAGPRTGKPAEDEDTREREKEERLFRLYQNIEEMMDNFEGYIEDTREQIESTKASMQQQVESAKASMQQREADLNELIRRAEATEARALAAVEALRTQEKRTHRQETPQSAAEAAPPEPPRRGRPDAVRELFSKGMTVEQIAQKLELSINEVKLVVYGMMSKNEKK